MQQQDGETVNLVTKIKETVPTDSTQNNGSFSYSYTSGNLIRIDWTIGGVVYRRTLTYDGDDNLTAMSVWVKQ